MSHGTAAGYSAHYRSGTPVCEPCRKAQSDYQRNRRRTTGDTRGTVVPVDLLHRIATRLPADDPLRAELGEHLR